MLKARNSSADGVPPTFYHVQLLYNLRAEISPSQEKYVRALLLCPVRLRRSKAFLGYCMVLCRVSNGCPLYAIVLCVQSQALSH